MDFYTWKKLLRGLVLPPTGPLIVAVVGFGLLKLSRFRRLGSALCGTGLAILWFLATPLIADALTRAVEWYPPLDMQHVPAADVIVILGGGVRRAAAEYLGDAPDPISLQRIAYGARLARASGLPVLLSGEHFEVGAMNEFLQRDFGLTPRWVENRSRDTYENAQFTAPILEAAHLHRVLLVTTAPHMGRAVAEFRAAGMEVVPAPTGAWTPPEVSSFLWVPNLDALRRSQAALYETLGNLVRWARERRANQK